MAQELREIAGIHCVEPEIRRLNGTLPRDIETICLKCLVAKENQRRSARLEVAEGNRLAAAGDGLGAVARLVEALELEPADEHRTWRGLRVLGL